MRVTITLQLSKHLNRELRVRLHRRLVRQAGQLAHPVARLRQHHLLRRLHPGRLARILLHDDLNNGLALNGKMQASSAV